jgi:lysophospholipase L1-like esterase
MTILFQGDSITDCGRMESFLDSMGSGYAYMVSSFLCAQYPGLHLKFINRGVSGNCIDDLVGRWDRDCLDLRPDVVSVLIGINDTWRHCTYDSIASSEMFEEAYRGILNRTKETCDPVFILCEPFLLHVSGEAEAFRDELDKRIDIVKKLKDEFNALYVPFDTMFTEASQDVDPAYWAPDGVHPTPAGHALMAKEWIRCVAGDEIP